MPRFDRVVETERTTDYETRPSAGKPGMDRRSDISQVEDGERKGVQTVLVAVVVASVIGLAAVATS